MGQGLRKVTSVGPAITFWPFGLTPFDESWYTSLPLIESL